MTARYILNTFFALLFTAGFLMVGFNKSDYLWFVAESHRIWVREWAAYVPLFPPFVSPWASRHAVAALEVLLALGMWTGHRRYAASVAMFQMVGAVLVHVHLGHKFDDVITGVGAIVWGLLAAAVYLTTPTAPRAKRTLSNQSKRRE